MALGCIAGPILGAVFSEYVSWRWIGWINLPVTGVALFLAVFFMRLKPIDQAFRTQLSRIDWAGMAVFTAGCILFVLPRAGQEICTPGAHGEPSCHSSSAP